MSEDWPCPTTGDVFPYLAQGKVLICLAVVSAGLIFTPSVWSYSIFKDHLWSDPGLLRPSSMSPSYPYILLRLTRPEEIFFFLTNFPFHFPASFKFILKQ